MSAVIPLYIETLYKLDYDFLKTLFEEFSIFDDIYPWGI